MKEEEPKKQDPAICPYCKQRRVLMVRLNEENRPIGVKEYFCVNKECHTSVSIDKIENWQRV